MARPSLEAHFQPDAAGGSRLYLQHCPPPGVAPRGSILYIHPWTEEMNKSRRMAAQASRELAAAGWSVLQFDLLGCGDSSGDFGEATWPRWIEDVETAAAWLCERHVQGPVWLWGLRLGALLAAVAHPRVCGLGHPVHLLLWQPVPQGQAALRQFLRLKAVGGPDAPGGKSAVAAAKAQLDAGHPVEVAGYRLHPELARGLERAELTPQPLRLDAPAATPRHLLWLEVSAQEDAEVGPAARATSQRWQDAGWYVRLRAVRGPAFWQTTEIEECPALIAATLAALDEVSAAWPRAA